MKTEFRGNPSSISLQSPNKNLFTNPTPPQPPPPTVGISGALNGCSLGSLDGACIEKLLLHCASALESKEWTLAQQVMWVLNNVASLSGDPNQRLTSWFLRALISRAAKVCPTAMHHFDGGGGGGGGSSSASSGSRRTQMTVTELAGYVDLIPWHTFGFCASNGAVLKAIQGCSKVHVLDFSVTHCVQWPTLIDALAKRPEGPPSLRLTVPSIRPPVPPLLNVSCEEVGLRLSNFAKFRDVEFEFNIIDGSFDPLTSCIKSSSDYFHQYFESLLTSLNDPGQLSSLLREDEVIVVNCQNWLRYLSDDESSAIGSLRDEFLRTILTLNPVIVVVVDEDADLNMSSLTTRITNCFNYLWIPFDALETFLPKDSSQRNEYESDIGHKIESVISHEGVQRMERLESGAKLCQRMKNVGFSSIVFCEDTVKEVKSLLDEHASGWGMKKEEEMLVLTWKGHNSVFATAWIPGGGFDQE
ncbi:Scarecrow-like protein 32 [Linum grandiflorum]